MIFLRYRWKGRPLRDVRDVKSIRWGQGEKRYRLCSKAKEGWFQPLFPEEGAVWRGAREHYYDLPLLSLTIFLRKLGTTNFPTLFCPSGCEIYIFCEFLDKMV